MKNTRIENAVLVQKLTKKYGDTFSMRDIAGEKTEMVWRLIYIGTSWV
ncbi:MAG: hypothetical protein QXK89_08695 [Candidatus Bathyarchaeia archaeon]